ncbi:MAG: S-methyl-5-thioribose-1-phosphate isomerase [Opitutaceae bacterium]|nr:S-methyl-5-thioribose-1-phosphate isomerase [Opitutaceae bacterium]
MNVAGIPYRTIWPDPGGSAVGIIDQTLLPHRFATARLSTLAEVAHAIRAMLVRGAPLIGATAAYGLALALRNDPSDTGLAAARSALLATRPTAVNLAWALTRMATALAPLPPAQRAAAAWAEAGRIAEEDVALNRALGEHGCARLEQLARGHAPGRRLEILTHCNAGWLATVDLGTALAPIYLAHNRGLPLHVWVDETRPRNQGASLTAWELGQHGVPHTLLSDNAGGHLLQHGRVDAVIVGADRVAANGDVVNKIDTYLKALAAHDCGVPFFVAVPGPTIDWSLPDGSSIPVEERPAREVTHIHGLDSRDQLIEVRLSPSSTPAANPAFDLTPARLITALITERGLCPATTNGLRALYPELAPLPPLAATNPDLPS